MRTHDAQWLIGPERRPRNLSADEAGSIHDDATANELGFRGGTVAGNIHMDQFPPLLLQAFGPAWFETGSLSLFFREPTIDREPVIAAVGHVGTAPAVDTQVAARLTTPEGRVIAEGTASVGEPSEPSALAARDLRPADPSTLRMLRGVQPGRPLDDVVVVPSGDKQRFRLAHGGITEPLDWYDRTSPWGGAIASPQTVVEAMYLAPVLSIATAAGPFVGMFGAIELRHVRGPMLVDVPYRVTGEVLAVADSPRTEVLWFRADAREEGASPDGAPVLSMTMMTRLLKASSPHWSAD